MFAEAGQAVIRQYTVQRQNKKSNNFLIDYYLDGFKKRREKRENKFIIFINYLTLISYLVCLLKFSISFVFNFKYETKLLLFDISKFFGGIQKYNEIILINAVIMGIGLNYKLRLAVTKEIPEWNQLFEITRSKVRPLFWIKRTKYDILDNLLKSTKILYSLISPMAILTGE